MTRVLSQNAVLALLAYTLVSCQKDKTATNNDRPFRESASTPSAIVIKKFDDLAKKKYVLRYADDGNWVKLYEDNPSTTEQYDTLRASYYFNDDGFLVRNENFTTDANGQSLSVVYTLSRNSQNELSYIITDSNFSAAIDTTYFSYAQNAKGTSITTLNRFSSYLYTFQYDLQNKLIELTTTDESAQYNYHYENGRLLNHDWERGKYWKLGAENFDLTIQYDSPLPQDESVDSLQLLLLGKDHYNHALQTMYFLNLYCDHSIDLPVTDPSHPSSMQLHYNQYWKNIDEAYQFRYAYGNDNRLQKIDIQSNTATASYEFIYP